MLWFEDKFEKSELMGVNVEYRRCVEFAVLLGCKVASFPSRYLGIPLSKGKARKGCWDSIVD